MLCLWIRYLNLKEEIEVLGRPRKIKITDFGHKGKRETKTLICEKCNSTKVIVDIEVQSVTCWICCVHMGPEIKVQQEKTETGFPRGWKFFKQFVHSDGRVFERGVENESLKGTLSPTKLDSKPKLSKSERRRLKEQKQLKKEQKLAKQYKKKMKLLKKQKEEKND